MPDMHGIIDTVTSKVNVPALLKLIEDLYAVLKKDIPDVLKPMQAKAGCCDHGACCDAQICLTLKLLEAQLAYKAQCEADACCGG